MEAKLALVLAFRKDAVFSISFFVYMDISMNNI